MNDERSLTTHRDTFAIGHPIDKPSSQWPAGRAMRA